MVLSILKAGRLEILVAVFSFVFLLFFAVLAIIERRLNKKLCSKIEERDSLFIELDKLGLSQEPNDMLLENLDSVAKRFFERDFGINRSANYSELIEIFVKNNKKNLADFSNKMLLALYSDEPITRTAVLEMIFQLETAINMEREEKKMLAKQIKLG